MVTFPDGRRVRGRGLRRPLPTGPLPELGVYLLGHPPDNIAWEHRWIEWHDFRTPSDRAAALDTLRHALDRAAEARVEVACRGGVGRTGTALAAMAVLTGVPAADAVAWVRANYHPRAVETPWQRRWLRTL